MIRAVTRPFSLVAALAALSSGCGAQSDGPNSEPDGKRDGAIADSIQSFVRITRDKRKWFTRSRVLPRTVPLKDPIDPRSGAARLLAGNEDQLAVETAPADVWFDDPHAAQYRLREEVIRIAGDAALALLTWELDA